MTTDRTERIRRFLEETEEEEQPPVSDRTRRIQQLIQSETVEEEPSDRTQRIQQFIQPAEADETEAERPSLPAEILGNIPLGGTRLGNVLDVARDLDNPAIQGLNRFLFDPADILSEVVFSSVAAGPLELAFGREGARQRFPGIIQSSEQLPGQIFGEIEPEQASQTLLQNFQSRPLPAQIAIGTAFDPTNILPISLLPTGRQAARHRRAVPSARTTQDPTLSKLIDSIRKAPSARRQTEIMRSGELSQRVARGMSAAEAVSPRERGRAFTSQLGGEQPIADFEPALDKFGNDELDNLYARIWESDLRPFDMKNTDDALTKVLHGQLPTRSEILSLNRIFGTELTDTILSKRPFSTRSVQNVIEFANIPRAIQTTFDMSAPLRQGLVLAPGHPKEFAKSSVDMMRSFFKEDAAKRIDQAITSHPNFDVMQRTGLHYSPRTGGAATLVQREEIFATRFIEKLSNSDSAILRAVTFPIRASERAYINFLNKFRFDIANNQYQKWLNEGLEERDVLQKMVQFNRFLNRATGRGSLGPLERIAPELNVAFFSPRLIASRVQVPLSLFEADPAVRKLVARDLAALAGTMSTVIGLFNLIEEVDVEADPRSSDFGKLRIGPTRVDVLAGFQPIIRYTTQIATQQRKSTTTGEISTNLNPGETIGRFLRSKLSPQAGALLDQVAGSDFLGEEVTPRTHLERIVPLIIQDINEGVRTQGIVGGAIGATAFFGTGIVSYRTPDDAARDRFGRPYSQLQPFQQDIARELHRLSNAEEPTGFVKQLDDLDRQQDEDLQNIARGIIPPRLSEVFGQIPGRRLSLRERRGLYFDVLSTYANLRQGILQNEFGEREARFDPNDPDPNRAALGQYYAALDAASASPGIFDSQLFNRLRMQLRMRWTPEQREYVAANTHVRDVPPQLLIILPSTTQREILLSMQARKAIMEREGQELGQISPETDEPSDRTRRIREFIGQ